jgi:pyrimidine operon attenuation protein/uracil phosphoribosyltransferase
MRTHFDEAQVKSAVGRLADLVGAAFRADEPLNIIGVRSRGDVLADRLIRLLRERGYSKIGRGVLDITLYRDDLSGAGARPVVQRTDINVDIDDKPLLLVDDVLYTGRSVRSALNALIDLGRPSVIRLAVLVDRGGRELPIQADFVAMTLSDVPLDRRVTVRFTEEDGKDEIVVEPHVG